jgi:hypothetical protein
MATQYYLLSTKQAAHQLSAQHWERVLGRPKKAQDTTTFLWVVMTNPNTDESMIVVTDDLYALIYPKLTPQEQQTMDNKLVPESDPRVQAIIASQPKW